MVSMAAESTVSVGSGVDGAAIDGMTQAGMVAKRVSATKKIRLQFMGSSLKSGIKKPPVYYSREAFVEFKQT
jgi:hypothetical protein